MQGISEEIWIAMIEATGTIAASAIARSEKIDDPILAAKNMRRLIRNALAELVIVYTNGGLMTKKVPD